MRNANNNLTDIFNWVINNGYGRTTRSLNVEQIATARANMTRNNTFYEFAGGIPGSFWSINNNSLSSRMAMNSEFEFLPPHEFYISGSLYLYGNTDDLISVYEYTSNNITYLIFPRNSQF